MEKNSKVEKLYTDTQDEALALDSLPNTPTQDHPPT